VPRLVKLISPVRRAQDRRADRVTLGLAGLAVAALGTLATGEILRMARRRRESGEVETPDTLVDAAELATIDTIAVARRGIRATPHHETVLFNLLQGFLGAFALARVSTWGIKNGWWPAGNVRLGGRHIHHFVPGIAIAFGSAIVGLVTDDEGIEATMAIPFGAGVGLTVDEAALLLDLRDVYWTREGILSVQVGLGVTAVLSAIILALRILRRGEEAGIEEGLIPGVSDTETQAAVGSLR
jgi:hypothetical protein